MILPGIVYKFASQPPISAHFLPQSDSGWSFSGRSQRGLAATILRRGSHLLLLQYKCKYGHLRTAGLWIMETGCPWYSWEGEHSATQKRKKKVHNPLLYVSFPWCLFAHTTVRRQPEVKQQWWRRRRWLHSRMLRALERLHLSLLSLFPFRDMSKSPAGHGSAAVCDNK